MPYVFGGRYPGQRGLDCAGFVCLRFEDGINLDIVPQHEYVNTSAQRILEACDRLEPGQERRGDLIFFHGTYDTPGASHVGIINDPEQEMMLDCRFRSVGGKGPGYTIYRLPYWREHFLAFGRVRR